MKFNKFFVILIILIIFQNFQILSTDFGVTPHNIKEINSIKLAVDILNKADKNTVVVFDIVDTLLISEKTDYNKKLKPNNTGDYSLIATAEDMSISLEMINCKRKLVEPEFVRVIENLQLNGIKVLALTHYLVGSYGLINSIQEWRFRQLFDLEIDFRKNFDQEIINLENFKAYNKTKPIFYKGILFTNNYSKGEVLLAFLEAINFKPTKIIGFDDRIEYLYSEEEYAKKYGIDFEGFHYLGAQVQ